MARDTRGSPQSFATACYSASTGYTERFESGDGAQALDSAVYTKNSVSGGAQTLTCTSALNESVLSVAIAYTAAGGGGVTLSPSVQQTIGILGNLSTHIL